MTKLNLLWASEMGTAMEVADNVASIAKEKSIDINQVELNDVSTVSYTHLTLPTSHLV